MLEKQHVDAAIAQSIKDEVGGFFDWLPCIALHEWVIIIFGSIVVVSLIALYVSND